MEDTNQSTAMAAEQSLDLDKIVADVLNIIEREREREIISRRFGLYDRKETLEQIGELLGITRERVRQLEKAVIAKLKAAEDKLPHMSMIDSVLTSHLEEMGRAARVKDLAAKLTEGKSDKIAESRLAFLAKLTPTLAVLDEDDNYHQSIGIRKHHDEKTIKKHVDSIVKTIREGKEPKPAKQIHESHAKLEDHHHLAALASISKKLSTLNGLWGLNRWPTVNPKNIRDKIYLVLQDKKQPMHFSEISQAITNSSFKRKDVTTQAIHNELIKDKRFVLIGRGIYALEEWGYSNGTVADVITSILRKADKPMHRDEIIKQVLKQRQVKETTVLLNLQGKPQFKRVAKATYSLDDQA